MNADAWIAIGGLSLTIILALIAHVRHDEKRHSTVETQIKAIQAEIGTHETGLRGTLHKQANLITRVRVVVGFIARHLKLDVARGVDDE